MEEVRIYNYTNTSPSAELRNALLGASGAIYYMTYIDHNFTNFVLKNYANGSHAWGTSYYTHKVRSNSVVLDAQENYLYTVCSNNYTPMLLKIIKRDASTGVSTNWYKQ